MVHKGVNNCGTQSFINFGYFVLLGAVENNSTKQNKKQHIYIK